MITKTRFTEKLPDFGTANWWAWTFCTVVSVIGFLLFFLRFMPTNLNTGIALPGLGMDIEKALAIGLAIGMSCALMFSMDALAHGLAPAVYKKDMREIGLRLLFLSMLYFVSAYTLNKSLVINIEESRVASVENSVLFKAAQNLNQVGANTAQNLNETFNNLDAKTYKEMRGLMSSGDGARAAANGLESAQRGYDEMKAMIDDQNSTAEGKVLSSGYFNVILWIVIFLMDAVRSLIVFSHRWKYLEHNGGEVMKKSKIHTVYAGGTETVHEDDAEVTAPVSNVSKITRKTARGPRREVA